MTLIRNLMAGLALVVLLAGCADAPAVPGTSTDQASSTEPTESNSDTTGPATECVNGVSGNGVYDYGAPSPGTTQTREEALANFNDAPMTKQDFVMQPEGWATQTDDVGNVVAVATFEELSKNYFVVGATISCVRP